MERRQKYSNSVRESKSREMSSSPSFSSFSSRGGRGAFETGPQPPVRPWRTDLEQTGTALPACRTRFRFPRGAVDEGRDISGACRLRAKPRWRRRQERPGQGPHRRRAVSRHRWRRRSVRILVA